ncbi:MAG: 50S ribosomal protein L9 [Candidatus Shikimatogenerans bostrichidophilus]|nr:MAG: 50S ribosomal protein L9 [Candidatus Shikimatogenerans bostrichidophilus]
MIRIILKKNIPNLGKKYKVLKVKSGYALNYLIPKQYAIIATLSEVKKNNEILRQKLIKKKYLFNKYEKYIGLINKINIIFYIKKKSKNIIKVKDILNKLKKNKIIINKNYITIENLIINDIGNYKIKIKLLDKLETYLNITVKKKLIKN